MTDGSGDAVTSLYAAFAAGDVAAAISVVEQARAVAVQRDLFDSLFAPAMAMLGGAWARGELDEYAFAEAAVVADQVVSFVTTPPALQDSGVTVVIGTMRDDGHAIAKNIVASVLRLAGHRVVDLGDNVTGTEFAQRAEDSGARIVIVCAEQLASARAVVQVSEALAAAGREDVTLLACGGPFVADTALARAAGVRGVVGTAEGALQLVDRFASVAESTSRGGASS